MKLINYYVAGLLSLGLGLCSFLFEARNLFLAVVFAVGLPYIWLNLKDLLTTRLSFPSGFSIAVYLVTAIYLAGPAVLYWGTPEANNILAIARGTVYGVMGVFCLAKWRDGDGLLRVLAIVLVLSGIMQVHTAVMAMFPTLFTPFSYGFLKMYGLARVLIRLAVSVIVGSILLQTDRMNKNSDIFGPFTGGRDGAA